MLKIAYLNLTTDSLGAAVETTPHSIEGIILSLDWYGNLAVVGLDALADLTIAVVDTGSDVDKTLLTLTNIADVNKEYHLRSLEHDDTGGDLATYASPAVMGKIQATIADGGDTKSAKLAIYYYSP